jgi:hypothetical protein
MISNSARFTLSASVILLFCVTACDRSPYKVNLSGIECDLTVRDLGREIFETPPHELSDKADTLRLEYGKTLSTYKNSHRSEIRQMNNGRQLLFFLPLTFRISHYGMR